MFNNQFKMTYEVINDSTKVIQVRIKGGIEYKVSPAENPPFNPAAYVRVKIVGVNLQDLQINPSNGTTAFDRELLRHLAAQRERTDKELLNPSINVLNQTLDVCVYLRNELVEKNQAIHSEILGVTLYTGHYDRTISALNTPSAALQEMAEEQDKSSSISMSIELVDPERRLGTLWTNCLGKAKSLHASFRPGLQPGLYIVFGGLNNEPVECHWPIDKLDNKILRENGIFITEREAIEGGNTEKLIQVESLLKETQKENRNYEAVFLKQNATISSIENKMLAQQSETLRNKHSTTVKDMLQKHEMSILKTKSSFDEFGSFVKNMSTVCSMGLTFYKLLT